MPEEGLAVQASYRMSDAETLEREVKALVSIHSFTPLRKAMIVTYEDEGTIEQNGLTIDLVPIWKWVLQ